MLQRRESVTAYYSRFVQCVTPILDEYDRAEAEWVEDIRAKIDAAIEASEHIAPVDGETFVNGILERFEQTRTALKGKI